MAGGKTKYIRTPSGIIRYDNNFDDDQVHMLELAIIGIRGEAEDLSKINTEDNYHHDKFIITKKCIGLELAENTADKDKNVATARTLATARNITVGLTTKSFNGGSDISYTLAEIGALPAAGGVLTGDVKRTNIGSGNIGLSLSATTNNNSTGIKLSNLGTGIYITQNSSGYGINIDPGINGIGINVTKSGGNYSAIQINNDSSTNGIILNTSGEISNGSNYVINGGKVYSYCTSTYLPLAGGTITGDLTVNGVTTFKSSVTGTTITATTFSGALSGNASTATKLATARTIALSGSVTGSASFDGSGNITISTSTNHTHSYLPLSGGTITGAVTSNSTITFGGNDGYGIRTSTNNYCKIGADDKRFHESFINNMHGAYLHLSSDGSATSTSYNGVLLCNTLTANRAYVLPDKSGIIAMTSDLDSYLPLSGGILTGDVTCNSIIAFSNNNNYGIRTITNNKVSIGADDKRFYRSYINYMYGASIFLSSNVSTTSTTYNGKLKCTTLTTDRVYTLPDKSGTIALISDISEAISSSGGTITGDLYVNGRLVNNGTGIEIYHATPYIDFHFNNSSDDYTSRIIETPSGVLNVSGALTASRFAAGWDSTYAGSISCSNWFRSSGNTGWYNASYGGGIYMEDSTWVKIYNGKNFYCSAQIKSSGGLLTENAESAGALAGLTIATSASYFRIRNDGGATYFMNGNSGGWTNYIIYYQDGKTTFPNDITCTGWVYPIGVEANYLQLNSESTTTYPANCYIDYNGYLYKTTTTSSKRFKDDISTTLPDELNPNKLYDVNVVQFKYKKDYFTNKDDIRYRKNLIGFIAEDIYEKYPIAADFHYDDNNEVVVDSWNPQYMIPAMLKLIQEQNKRIKILEAQILNEGSN